MILLNPAHWLLTVRSTAAAPGATDFLGAALAEADKGTSASSGPGTIAVLFGLFWKLALVTGLIIVTVWALRRLLKTGGIPLVAQGAVKVLSVTHLDTRRSIYLLEVGDRLLVVGGGGESLNLLAEITSPVEKGQVREHLREGEGGKFTSYLAQWATRMAGGGGPAKDIAEGKDFLAKQLKAMRKGRTGEEGQGKE